MGRKEKKWGIKRWDVKGRESVVQYEEQEG